MLMESQVMSVLWSCLLMLHSNPCSLKHFAEFCPVWGGVGSKPSHFKTLHPPQRRRDTEVSQRKKKTRKSHDLPYAFFGCLRVSVALHFLRSPLWWIIKSNAIGPGGSLAGGDVLQQEVEFLFGNAAQTGESDLSAGA